MEENELRYAVAYWYTLSDKQHQNVYDQFEW